MAHVDAYFLFMIDDSIQTEDVWAFFFQTVPVEYNYKVLVHCSRNCTFNHTIFTENVIPQVSSKWCQDLVSPVNQLLLTALNDCEQHHRCHRKTKLILVAKDEIPVKPARHVFYKLLELEETTFCYWPLRFWAHRKEKGVKTVFPKTHYWYIFTLNDAETIVAKWKSSNFSIEPYFNRDYLVRGKRFGCIDEYWFYAILFNSSFPSTVNKRLTNIEQGVCLTYIPWLDHIREGSPFSLITVLKSRLSRNKGGTYFFDEVSEDTFRDLYSTGFLFARKFHENTVFKTSNGTSLSLLSGYKLLSSQQFDQPSVFQTRDDEMMSISTLMMSTFLFFFCLLLLVARFAAFTRRGCKR